MAEIVVAVNYLGKLMELGQKCKFVVDPEVVDVPGLSPTFKCIIRIPNYDILVEQVGSNKKSAKSAAAQIAFEKICEKIQENQASSLDKIANKLKEISVSSDKLTSTVDFFKKMALIDASKVDVVNGNSFSELMSLLTDIQCTLSYKHKESKDTDDGPVEHHFVCEIRPTGALSPVVIGCGWSRDSLDEAKIKAVNQLLAILKAYKSQ